MPIQQTEQAIVTDDSGMMNWAPMDPVTAAANAAQYAQDMHDQYGLNVRYMVIPVTVFQWVEEA